MLRRMRFSPSCIAREMGRCFCHTFGMALVYRRYTARGKLERLAALLPTSRLVHGRIQITARPCKRLAARMKPR
jgi:hypothetical protein